MLRSNHLMLHPQKTLLVQADMLSQCLHDKQVHEYYTCDILIVATTPCFIFIFSVSFCIKHLLAMFREDEKLEVKNLAPTAKTIYAMKHFY